MIAIACTLLSAVAFYFSIGLGDQWWLLWIAPVPVLWLAFGPIDSWRAFFAAWLAAALGALNIVPAYAGAMPFIAVLAVGGPALVFAASVMGARRVQRALGPVAAMFAFAALWTMWDFLLTFDLTVGSAASPAAAEVGAPILIQGASLVGFMGVTFLLGAVSAGLALGLRLRDVRPAALAVALFSLNAAWGYWHMLEPPKGTMKVALIESDDAVGGIIKPDMQRTLKAVDAYRHEIAKLHDAKVALIVLPENIAQVAPEWRDAVQAGFQSAANETGAVIVAGFNTRLDGAQRNISWSFQPNVPSPVTYEKRRLVKGVETRRYTPGSALRVLPDGIGLEICKDMDFQAMIREDEVATKPTLLAVPAWDFDKDDWSHARVAVLRSVENSVPMARTARDGLLILNDRYGRIVARARSVGGFTTLIGELPLDGRGGNTLYDRIGDLFGWVCVVLGLGLVGVSYVRSRRALQ
jgi:apolipoprotein N-acyltransferase